MSSQGDAGQFRTPRHIIDFIVDVINPTKNDKVLDPACGTGGFLVSTYNHILEQHDGKNDPQKKEKPLTPDERKKLMANLEGYDIDPTMVRIAQVNMYLHQFKNPQIFQYDSLTSEERWNDKFDVILANPPFMSPKGGIKPHNKFSVPSNRSEVLFVDYIVNHLRPKGRAGIIVPEGIIFQSGNAYRALRKNLVENGLYAVISLPGGVFQPYSGVKTSILLFDNELAKQKSEIAFVKILADGFELGSTKRAISQNDLPGALSAIQEWRESGKCDSSLVVLIPKTQISATKDFNLSGGRYVDNADRSNTEWSVVKLETVCNLVRGVTFAKNDEVIDKGQGVLTASNLKLDGTIDLKDLKMVSKEIVFKETQRLLAEDIFICLASGSQAHVGKVSFITSHLGLYFGGFMGAIRVEGSLINSKYLYYQLRSPRFNNYLGMVISGANIRNLSSDILGRYEIPLPPLEVQEQIVAELDGYAAIISGAKQIVENWKPRINVNPEWPQYSLGQLVSIDKQQANYEGLPFVGLEDIESNSGRFLGKMHPKKVKSSTYRFDSRHVLYGQLRPYLNKYLLPNFEGHCSTEIQPLLPSKELHREFLGAWLASNCDAINATSFGARMPRAKMAQVFEMEIKMPDLSEQNRLVEEIREEFIQVESSRKLIETYEARTQAVIAKLWRE